jgi:hypothetical protein
VVEVEEYKARVENNAHYYQHKKDILLIENAD